MRKLCEACGAKPATVPDRRRVGRLINRLCATCHGYRLAEDLRRIVVAAKNRTSVP